MAFTHYSPVSINAAQVPSTQSDFAVLVSWTDNRFKTIGNGGHVADANGYDIRPYSDTGHSSALSYELERYNGSTGEVIMWVKVASLSSSTTPIYLFYGDAALNTDGTSSATWSNGYQAVYHMKDGTTLSGLDSARVISIDMLLVGPTAPTATTGQIDGGANFVAASSQKMETTGAGPVGLTALTLSGWVKGSTFPTAYNAMAETGTFGSDQYALYVKSNGKLKCIVFGSNFVSYDGTGSHTLSADTWYYLAMTYSASAGLTGYVNAASDQTAAANGDITNFAGAFAIGYSRVTGADYWNGVIDEVRVAQVVRSADWITTEYNNQLSVPTFETLGGEVSLLVSSDGRFIPFFNT